MIKHGSFDIPGTHGLLVPESFGLQVRRQHFWGVRGTAQIVSEPALRPITVELWAFDGWTDVQAAQSFLDDLDDQIGVTATLTNETGGATIQSFGNCCFDAWEILALPGAAPAIMRDVAGTVETNVGNYFIPLRLTWTQLV